MTSSLVIAPLASVTPTRRPNPRQVYSCPECDHALRVFGGGRHRVYFELGDERLDEPVMTGACPACGQGLPGKNATGLRP